MYQDVQSGPATGGEGGNGIYVDIYGLNFGASQGSSTVTVNGTPVAQYVYWGADPTRDRQQIGVQIASGTTGTGQIVVTTPGGTCSNLTFTVRSGHIWFVGPSVDTSAPGNCSALQAANSYSTPGGLTNYASTSESDYNASTMRTPYTYYSCMSLGDVLVFLNGVNYPYFDGRGWHASLTPDKAGTTPSSFVTIMARPGATATLGGEGWAMSGIRNTGYSTYTVYAGLTLVGSGNGGSGLDPSLYDRPVGNTIMCPSCYGQAGSLGGATGNEALGNVITNVSTDTVPLPNGSNKQYHDVYFQGNNFEFAWNRIYNTAAYNGFQINEDGSTGFYNFAVHDNDIADVNGSGVNLSDIDPSSGYVQVYNNIIHHTGVNIASDGDGDDPHSCIAVKGYGSSTGVGAAEIYNNTMFDCSSYLNLNTVATGSCAVLVYANQLNVTTNLVNNIFYQPAYAGTASQNVYVCGGGAVGTISGSNNIWYSASTPGSTAYATAVGTIENPLYVNPSDGPWTNYELQSSSPASGAGISVGPINLAGISNTFLTWDFDKVLRPSPPSIGALESAGTSSGDLITINASPNPASQGQSVTLTSTVGQTAGSLPTGSINFMNGSVSLGQAALDGSGTATLTLSTLAAGSYSVVGSYSGDAHYLAGQSAAAPLQVISATNTSLVASPNPVTAGQTLNLVATVSASGTASLSGIVNFMSGSTVLGSASVNSSGVATLSTASLSAGTYSLTARYVGNSSFGSSTSAASSVTVTASIAATTTSLVASPNTVTTGQTLNLVATVSANRTASLSGTVNFINGSTVLGSGSVNTSGVATLSTASLPAGTYSLIAQYVGNSSFGASKSAATAVTVTASTAATTRTSLVASPNTVPTGQTLNLVATVSASGTASLSGTVNFMNGSTVLGSASVNASGVATLSTASLPAGTYSLTARFVGNSSFGASTSAAASVTVTGSTATTTTTRLVASPNPVSAGQTLNMVATVSASGTTSLSGTVNFLNGSTVLGSASVSSSGVATLSTASLPAGTYSLTAQYLGNASLGASTSAAASVTVNAALATTSISLVATPNPVTEGQALILTATVTESGTSAPAGTVSFMNGATVLGTAALNSSGVATLSITSLAVGTYSLTAQYPSTAGSTPQGSSGASPAASASATVLVTVDAATAPIAPSFTMTVTGSTPSSVSPGQTAVYSLVVAPTTGTALPAITFAASGLPAGATATFSPQRIAAGEGRTNVTLSIQAPAAQSARLERSRELNGGLPVVALCLLLLPFGRRSRRFGKRLVRLSSLVLLLAGAASLVGLAGCGADVTRSTVQSYTVTVTSASASVSQTAQVTLAVE